MTLRSTLFLLIFALFVLPKAYALESPEPPKGEEYKIEKGFEEKIDAIISKRLHLSSVRSKLENTNSKFVAVYGHVLEANDKRALESADEEDLFVAESLFFLLSRISRQAITSGGSERWKGRVGHRGKSNMQ